MYILYTVYCIFGIRVYCIYRKYIGKRNLPPLQYISLSQLCVILEPMQELMSRHKAYGLNPRDCLKTTLFQKWQRMVAPPGKIIIFTKFHLLNRRIMVFFEI